MCLWMLLAVWFPRVDAGLDPAWLWAAFLCFLVSCGVPGSMGALPGVASGPVQAAGGWDAWPQPA